MKISLRGILLRLGLVVGSLCILALAFELVVFRFVLVASDFPVLEEDTAVLRFRPDQAGTYRRSSPGCDFAKDYRINANGWNSGHTAYDREKRGTRIAIIGDSYVEALQVDYDESLAEQLEKLGPYEVYRFGVSGAPLSQYLHVLREEVATFQPDLVVFLVVHNDLDESYRPVAGVHTKSFLQLDIRDGEVVGERPPRPFVAPWYAPIRNSATFRYLSVRRQVKFGALRALLLPEKPATNASAPRFEANIDVAALAEKEDSNRAATAYVLARADQLCERLGCRFAVVMDGVRELIYSEPERPLDPYDSALLLNRIVRDEAGALGVPFVDLHDDFAREFRSSQARFEYPCDGHWNERGHGVAAAAIHERLMNGRRGLGEPAS